MNKVSNTFFIAFIFLAGCTNNVESKTPSSSIFSSQPTTSLTASSQPTMEQVLPIHQSIQDWTVSLISKSSKSDLPIYEFELTYKGVTKAENIVVETGNAIAKSPLIEKNQGMRIGSSYSSNVKQIKVVVSWDEGDKAFKQTVLFELE